MDINMLDTSRQDVKPSVSDIGCANVKENSSLRKSRTGKLGLVFTRRRWFLTKSDVK